MGHLPLEPLCVVLLASLLRLILKGSSSSSVFSLFLSLTCIFSHLLSLRSHARGRRVMRRLIGQLDPFLPPRASMPTKPAKLALVTEARLVALAWLHGNGDAKSD